MRVSSLISYGASAAVAVVRAESGLALRQLASTAAQLGSCPGYTASNVHQSGSTVTADLKLAGNACNAYGTDIEQLKLSVTYETEHRLHVKIVDSGEQAYQVPTSVFPRPSSSDADPNASDLQFAWKESPFSFSVKRRSTGEILFDSAAASLVFEDQYIRLRTALPNNPNLYGLGEHSDNFRLNTTDYTRTFWSRDAYGIPEGGNLYGNHPVYFDHRGQNGTHAVFLLSSAGMDVKINHTDSDGQYLEYNTLGGVVDLYFISGKTPADVSRGYAQVAGTPAAIPYWSLGFHNCRYGYRDVYAVAEVITNYSNAGIPLETMWTDIDYMRDRLVFTTDPDRYPVPRLRDIVDYLHKHDQHYIVMVDPAVGNQNYSALQHGVQQDVFLKYPNGTLYQGVVWPGPTVYPDWFHPNTGPYWTNEFLNFFGKSTGVDIDGLWIDMNEAANFCPFPCTNPQNFSAQGRFPPQRPFVRSQPRVIPGFPAEFQPGASDAPPDGQVYNDPNLQPASSPSDPGPPIKRYVPSLFKRQNSNFSSALDTPVGFPDRNFLAPPYRIKNSGTYFDVGGLSNQTIRTDLVHYHGLRDLDIHNLYGSMMSEASRNAMLARRPGLRPLIITRSTFAGVGRNVGKWLGDNLSTWAHYRNQIQGMLDFSALFQVPMVGSDVCGFGDNTTEQLCSRWATLGAFNPFYRNHNQDVSIPQEFYIWPTVAEAARTAISLRYRLLDYFYTQVIQQTVDGTPSLNPVYFLYPNDPNTFGIQLQFFYGNALLVSPVTEENATSVDIYLPNDLFYDFYTLKAIQGTGAKVTIDNQNYTTPPPLHIRAGTIIPLREKSANTTTALRTIPFELLVAPLANGTASGMLYLDDGVSLVQNGTSNIVLSHTPGKLAIGGTFGYGKDTQAISLITVCGIASTPTEVHVDGTVVDSGSVSFDNQAKMLKIKVGSIKLGSEHIITWAGATYTNGSTNTSASGSNDGSGSAGSDATVPRTSRWSICAAVMIALLMSVVM